MRCVYCLAYNQKKTKDHPFPKSWYTDNTSSTVQSLTVPDDYQKYVEIDPRYFRPTEVDRLLGDASKAQTVLGWKPHVTFKELVKIMVDADQEKL